MSEIKNLNKQEAVEKLQSLVSSAEVCLFTTALEEIPLTTRPMSTQKVDDEGNLWFLSQRSSEKNAEIAEDPRVQLFYFNKSSSEYLSVYGTASILRDREKAKEIWSPLTKAWFPEGVDDPELTIIKVQPEDAHYWDTKYNKMVAIFQLLAGAVIGKPLIKGVEGELSV